MEGLNTASAVDNRNEAFSGSERKAKESQYRLSGRQ